MNITSLITLIRSRHMDAEDIKTVSFSVGLLNDFSDPSDPIK